MPTENRSSNTELSKIVTEALVGMVSGVTGMKPPADEPLPGFIQAPIDRAVTRISGLLAQPAPQPHPEPIAWMVGTAIWWTKEEAERDAAATGKPIIPFGPMIDTGEVDRLRAALSFYADREHYHFESGNWDTVSGEPLNILWCGEEPDFIEDGSVARAALERKL
ncbi:hypothetical protein QEL91_002268 [Pseudomonas putida]|nr:hypothetical protein [Pseudomonas putida]